MVSTAKGNGVVNPSPDGPWWQHCRWVQGDFPAKLVDPQCEEQHTPGLIEKNTLISIVCIMHTQGICTYTQHICKYLYAYVHTQWTLTPPQ